MTNLNGLLEFIRAGEAPKGYGQIYGGAKGVSLKTDVSKMTIGEVLRFQDKMKAGGSKSTAVGAYQFIKKTLVGIVSARNFTGKEVMSPSLQDNMASYLLEVRGLNSYVTGRISAEAFANNLAKEWASLPVVTAIRGNKGFVLKPGQSYYAGDGLNKSQHDPKKFLAVVKAIIVD